MAKTLMVVLFVFGYLFLVGPVCILYTLLRGNADLLYQAGRLACHLGIKLAGIKLDIRGLDYVKPGKTYLFLANHQSNCDPPALLLAIPRNVRFILKKELNRVPVLNIAMRLGGFVFIDRKDRANAVEGMNRAVEQLQQGDSFLIFPEGTRSRTGRIGAFKKGPFIIAIQAGVPILPITISGSYEIMPATEFRLSPGTITVNFHPEIETQGLDLSHRETLMEEVKGRITSSLQPSEQPLLNVKS